MLEKQAKNKEKVQEKVNREKKKLSEIERERNIIEERLNSTKCFDELYDDESRLKKLNEEDQAIIDDINATESEKEAAQERMTDRNEELVRLHTDRRKRSCHASLKNTAKTPQKHRKRQLLGPVFHIWPS